MYWYETQEYLNELPDLITTLNNNALYSAQGQIVVDTYSKDFSYEETKNIILLYAQYSITNKSYITDFNDSEWLINPYYKYIVSTMLGTTSYNWDTKGLRDRIWVILAELAKLNNKWYKPYQFQLELDTKQIIPSDKKTEEQKKSNIGKFLIIGLAVAGVTKALDLW